MQGMEDLWVQVQAVQAFERIIKLLQVGHAGIEGNRNGAQDYVLGQRLGELGHQGLDFVAMAAGIGKELQDFDLSRGVGWLGDFQRDILLVRPLGVADGCKHDARRQCGQGKGT